MKVRRLHAADRALMWLLLIAAAMAGLRYFAPEWIPAEIREDMSLFAVLLILQEILLFALPALAMSREAEMPRPKQKRPLGTGLALAGTAVLHQMGLTLLSLIWCGLLSLGGLGVTTSTLPLPANGGQALMTLAAYALAPALCEEWLFRGRVLPRLASRFSLPAAVSLTAVSFALMHGSLGALPSHLAAGVMLTVLALHHGLPAAMGYHFVFNAASLGLTVLDARWGWQALLTAHPSLLMALTGLLLLLGALTAWGLLRGLRLQVENMPEESPLTGYLLAALCLVLLLPYGLQLLPV